MISAEDFLAQNTPRSALEPFHNDIAKLRAAKMSYQKIQAFLKLNGVDTHVNNVRGYCQRHIEKKALPAQEASSTKKGGAAKNNKTSPQKIKTTQRSQKSLNAKAPIKKRVQKKTIDKKIPAKKIGRKSTTNSSEKKEDIIESLQASLF